MTPIIPHYSWSWPAKWAIPYAAQAASALIHHPMCDRQLSAGAAPCDCILSGAARGPQRPAWDGFTRMAMGWDGSWI
jgi:hypothetical protein